MDSLIQDLKYAVRSIAGAKKFAAIVIATLALGHRRQHRGLRCSERGRSTATAV